MRRNRKTASRGHTAAVAVVAGFGLAALAAAATDARAGTVTIESQQRRVGTNVFIEPPDADFIDTSDNAAAPDAGPFDASVAVDSGRDDYLAEASASMASTIGQGGFRFAGGLAFETDDRGMNPGQAGASAGAGAVIDFSLDEPYRYELDVDSTTLRSGGSVNRTETVRLLAGLDGVPSDLLEGGGDGGVLPAGTYRFELTKGVNAGDPRDANEGFFAEEYDVRFALTEADGGGTPIPLPPAVYAGLTGLVMAAGACRRLRRRQAGN